MISSNHTQELHIEATASSDFWRIFVVTDTCMHDFFLISQCIYLMLLLTFSSRLVAPMGVVFECGPNCGCGPDCVNRTSQKGMRYRLEVL